MPTTSLRLLGDVSVVRPDGSTAVLRRGQARTVAALLVLERHRVVARSELADVLWSDELPPHWAGAVRGVVSKVRAFLESAGLGGVLVSAGDGWRLDLDAAEGDVEVDVERARARIERARAEGAALDPLAEALRSLGDELAPGAHGHWVERQREDLARLRRHGLMSLVDLAAAEGRQDLRVDAALELSRVDPYSDAAARELVTALVEVGDPTAATEAADAFVRRLDRDLGVEPEPDTVAAFGKLFTAMPRPRPRRPVPIAAEAVEGPLVGRRAELDDLRAAWAEVVAGGGARSALVVGEPGAGKTRLAWETSAFVDDGVVLWGRCSADGRVGFEPVVEALDRALPAGLGPLEDLGDGAGLFPNLTDALRSVVAAPSVWVVDDLHWANEDTTALLTHLVAGVSDLPLLVVFTTRTRDGSAAALLEVTARTMPTRTVGLRGLDASAVGDLLASTGFDGAGSLGERVRDRTGGNPFFVRELVRSASDGVLDPDGLPDTLRSWIHQRVAALGPGAAELLAAASVLAPTGDVDVLAAMVGRDRRQAVRDVDSLLSSGLLVEPEDGADVAFAHALTRDAVVEGLSRTMAQQLHRAAADALEAVRPGSAPAEVAAHLAAAGPSADARAVPAMLAAGSEALATTAWASASRWFTDVLDRRAEPGPERVDALVGLGAALRGLGDRAGARAALDEALAAAVGSGAARQVARATLGLVGGGARGVADDLADAERAGLLATAIDGLGPEDDDLRIPLQLELSLALLLTDRDDERRELAEDALARARALGRPDLLGRALVGHRLAHHGPEHAELRLREADEVLRIDARHRSHDVTMSALMSRHEDAMVVGDRALARSSLAAADEAVTASGHPYWRWVVRTWQVLDAIVDGRLDDAEALAFEAVALQSDHPEATACLGVNLVDVRLFQGRSGEVVDLLGGAAAVNPHIPAYRGVLALCLAEAGELERAEAEYRWFAARSFADVPDDTNRLLCLAVLADVAATIGDADGARALLELLAPHSDRQVVLNCFAGGGAFWGPVDTQLGRLSMLLGDAEAADRYLTSARTSAAAFGAPLALARIPVVG